jgi:hypothetical protein
LKASKKWTAQNQEWQKAYNKKRRAMDEAKGENYVLARKARRALAQALHPERLAASMRKYMQKPEAKKRARERQKRWRENNREKLNAAQAKRGREKTKLRQLNRILGISEATPIDPAVIRAIKRSIKEPSK